PQRRALVCAQRLCGAGASRRTASNTFLAVTERANLPGSPFDGAEIIYSYTREQALADRVLIDVSELAEAREAGFVWPVAISRALWEIVVPTDAEEAEGQSYEGRLWDVL